MIERLKRSRVIQALVVYAGFSWVVLQLVGTLNDLLELPDWVGPATVVLLGVGLLLVGATAWVQSLDSTTQAEEAGDLPSDWQLAPGDLVASLKHGRLPHLTFARAAVVLVVALSLTIGAAGGYVLLVGGGGLLGPTPVGASDVATGVAVLPFGGSGGDLNDYREGMVGLIGPNIDGVDDLRAIAPGTVMSRWRAAFEDRLDVPLDSALLVGGETGARYAMVGTMTGLGDRTRLTADVYDLENGDKIASSDRVEGPLTDVVALIDELSVSIVRALLGATGIQGSTGTLRLASIVTTSIPALRAYLEGEAFHRRSLFPEAAEAFERAVEQDSTFALAYSRLGDARGWVDGFSHPAVIEANERAAAFADRLPSRERTLVLASRDVSRQDADHIEELRTHVRRFPDDAEAWYLLGEYFLHSQKVVHSEAELNEALENAVRWDPTFAPFYVHAMQLRMQKGDRPGWDTMMVQYRTLEPGERRLARVQWEMDFFRGTPEEQAAAEAILQAGGGTSAAGFTENVFGFDDVPHRVRRGREILAAKPTEGAFGIPAFWEIYEGRWADAVAEAAGGLPAQGLPPEYFDVILNMGDELYGMADSATRRRLRDLVLEEIPEPFRFNARLIRFGSAITSGELPLAKERLDEFRALVREGLEGLDPESLEALNARDVLVETEVLYLLEEDPTEALQRLRTSESKLLNAGTPYPSWYVRMGDALAATGARTEAIRHYESALRTWARPYVRLRMGEVYDELGDTEQALRNYRAFLSLWVDADEGLEVVERTRAAVARLGG